MASQGYQLLALGSRRYLEMAAACAMSLRLVDPTRPIQIVTDGALAENLYADFFDVITRVEFSPELIGPLAKLKLPEYMAFEETLFVDCDCLAFRQMDPHWRSLADHDVAFVARIARSGEWYRREISDICRHFDIPYLAQGNSGVLYLTRRPATWDLFQTAWQIWEQEGNFLNHSHRGKGASDEPYLGIAYGILGIAPYVQWGRAEGELMVSTLNASKFEIDITVPKAHFMKGRHAVAPAIVHFVGTQPIDTYQSAINDVRRTFGLPPLRDWKPHNPSRWFRIKP